MNNTAQNKSALIALISVCLIWGTTYLVNKLGVSAMPPFFFIGVRQFVAGILIIFFLFATGKLALPDRSFLFTQSILGLLMISVGNGVGILGLQYIDSGISAIMSSTSPLLIALLYASISSTKISSVSWTGLILGTLGILIICLTTFHFETGNKSWLGFLCTSGSVIAWSVGSVYSKIRNDMYNPLEASGYQLLLGSIPILLSSFITEDPLHYTYNLTHFAIWTYVIVFGSIIAYSCYIYCLEHLPVSMAGLHTYVNPIIALFLGSLFLNEKMTFSMLIGSVITLIGVYLVSSSHFKFK